MAILEFYNEDRIKQFDSEQLPLILKQKLTMDASLDVGRRTMGGNTNSRVVVWNTQVLDISNIPGAVVAFSGPVFAKLNYVSATQISVAYQRTSATLEIYVFGTGSTGSISSGFAMWTEAGDLTLTADDLPMRPVGGATYAIANQRFDPAAFHLQGPKLAAILVSSAQIRSSEDNPDDQSFDRVFISQVFIRADAGTVSVNDAVYTTLRIPTSETDNHALNTGSYLVLDVTGF